MDIINDFVRNLLQGVPDIIAAILLLLVAFVVAGIARSIIKKVLEKLNISKHTDKLGITNDSTGSSVDFIGNLVYVLVFLLFVPAIFGKLGLQSASAPILNMLTQFLGFIPNIIAAIIIIVIGVFLAKIVKQILLPVLKRLNVDKLQEKAGIEANENTSISNVLASLVYVLVLLPMIIAALQVLNIRAISEPAIAMLNQIFAFLPKIFVALAILFIGLFLAKMLEKLLSNVLASLGVDSYLAKVVDVEKGAFENVVLSKLIGAIVKYIVSLLFVVEAFNVLELAVLQNVGVTIIEYLPQLVSAIIILILAYLLASWIERLIKNRMEEATILAFAAKAIIMVIAVIMTLSQLGIATSIVNAAFIIILSAVAVAFAISFGIGGRDFAAYTMKKFEKKDK